MSAAVELLRDALRRYLDRLASEGDADRWRAAPLDEDEGERSLDEIADGGPAEDWSDWVLDAARWDLVRRRTRG